MRQPDGLDLDNFKKLSTVQVNVSSTQHTYVHILAITWLNVTLLRVTFVFGYVLYIHTVLISNKVIYLITDQYCHNFSWLMIVGCQLFSIIYVSDYVFYMHTVLGKELSELVVVQCEHCN